MSSPSNNLSAYVDASPPARPGWDPQWLAANEHCVPEKLDSCRLRIDEELTGLVWRLSGRHCGRCIVPSDPHFPEYLQRLKLCIDFHWRRWGETARLTFAEVVRRLDQERADAKPPKDNILAEVVLAQGLQLGEDQCARTFESIYMPVVRAVGRHLGGERAADVVENFAAELVLPRQGRPPRIATFQGRTTLSHWLVPVVSNYWRTGLRRKSGIALSLVPEPPAHAAEAESLDEGPCEGMLQHVFAHTAETLEPGDRLLLQMLVLDGVPQKQLARTLGLHSGTLTRRRQRATETLLMRLRDLTAQSPNPRGIADCLQLVLAGEDPELRCRLANVLACSVRGEILPS